MHTPYCMELRGTFPTVVVPRPGQQTWQGYAGLSTLLAPTTRRTDVHRSQALVACVVRQVRASVGDQGCALVLCFNGYTPNPGGSLDPMQCSVVGLAGTVTRFIIPQRVTALGIVTLDVDGTGDEVALSWWTEDLSPLGYGSCRCARPE